MAGSGFRTLATESAAHAILALVQPAQGLNSPGNYRTGAHGGEWRRACLGQRPLACSSSSFLNNLLGWKVNEVFFPGSSPVLILCLEFMLQITMGLGPTCLLFFWVMAETLSGQMCYLLHGSLCAVTVCRPRDESGLLVSMLALALSLSKVNNEADIFYLYIDIYILKQQSPVFAYYNQFLRLMVVERLTVSKN